MPPHKPHFLNLDLAPYAGRYIALVSGRVVAVGDTAEAAHARARLARQQRPATILFIAPVEEDQPPTDDE